MEYGRILVLAGILAGCLLGCSVNRSAGRSDNRRAQEQSRYDYLYAQTDAKLASSTSVVDRWRNIRIIRRDFDLDRQPDENGRFPVKSETVIEGNEQQTEKTEEASKADTETKKQETGTKNLDLQTDRTETGEFNAESGKNSLWWWLIGVLMAVIGIIYLWWKYGKKDKTK